MDRLQESVRYGSTNIDNRIFEKVQNVQTCRQLPHENNGKLKGGTTGRQSQ